MKPVCFAFVGTLLASCGANAVDPCGTVFVSGAHVVDIAAGASHTCVRFDDGSLACWGRDALGETGASSSRVCPQPNAVTLPRGRAIALAVGNQSTTALLDDGTIVSWGALTRVIQEITNPESAPFPRWELRLEGTRRIANGGEFGCALDEAGTARCWGRNEQGMLGDGSIGGASAAPAVVDANIPFATIVSGESVTCGAERSGAVSCWGAIDPADLRASPVRAVDVTSAVDVVVAGYRRCALLRDGTVTCWDGTHSPAPVAGLVDIVQLAGGGALCALSRDGAVRCWLPPRAPPEASVVATDGTPRIVTGLPRIARVAVGKAHACALGDDATVWCWGGNRYGQLGTGNLADTQRPTRVVDL